MSGRLPRVSMTPITALPAARSRPGQDWRILLELAGKLGLPLDWRGPEEIFHELAKACAPFEGLSYETIGTQGVDVATAKPAPGTVAP